MKIGELGMIASRSPVEVDYEFFFTYMYTRIKRIGKNNSLRNPRWIVVQRTVSWRSSRVEKLGE